MGNTVFDYVAFKRLCAYKGILLEDVAAALNIKKPTLWRKMRGINEFTRSELEGMATFLRESVNSLEPIFFCRKSVVKDTRNPRKTLEAIYGSAFPAVFVHLKLAA